MFIEGVIDEHRIGPDGRSDCFLGCEHFCCDFPGSTVHTYTGR